MVDEAPLLQQEWTEHMENFIPADMITFEISARGEEEFFEDIRNVPSQVRGAWFTSSSESRDIGFYIYDPLKKVVFSREGRKEAVFFFEATRRGVYSFVFKNTKMLQSQSMTFALHCGNSTEEMLQTEHLDPLEKQMLSVQKSVKDFQMDQQFAQLRQESHYQTVADANRNVLWLSFLECFGVIAVSSWQVFYIKKLLDNRRVL